METTIPAGTIVKLRRNGDYEYAKIVDVSLTHPEIEGGFCIQYGLFTDEQKAKAVKAVWKERGTKLEQR